MSEEPEEGFPGLNKRHGFFKAIERNQLDRDSYHRQRQQQETGARTGASERRDGSGGGRRRKQQPTMELYRPPHLRQQKRQRSSKATTTEQPSLKDKPSSRKPASSSSDSFRPLYRLEVELLPGEWHKIQVRCLGNGEQLARGLAAKVAMEDDMMRALEEMIAEFEEQLKIAE